MQKLMSSCCPPECKASAQLLANQVPAEHQDSMETIVSACRAAGAPLMEILNYLATNASTIVEMFQKGFDLQKVINLILGALKIVIPAPA